MIEMTAKYVHAQVQFRVLTFLQLCPLAQSCHFSLALPNASCPMAWLPLSLPSSQLVHLCFCFCSFDKNKPLTISQDPDTVK